MRLFYAAGPGDVVGTYEHWIKGQDDPSQVAMTYSGQFFSLCEELDAQGEIVSACTRMETRSYGRFNVSNVPKAFMAGSVPAYIIAQVRYGLEICARALAFGADVAVIAEGTSFWFVFSKLARSGIRVVPAMHCTLWPKLLGPSKSQRLINFFDAVFFRKYAFGILSISSDVTAQIMEITKGRHAPITPFLPTYRLEAFAGIPPADHKRTPFRLIFAGRIEENKGVFDLLEAISLIYRRGRSDIHIDLCGNGSALERICEEARRIGLSTNFVCHGYCNHENMMKLLAMAHAVVVPTRSDFVEGFNKVVAEAVLAGRPVITSKVCPALDYVRGAVVEVLPDNPESYAQAIVALADNLTQYEFLYCNCQRVAAQFYDRKNSWQEGLKSILLKGGGFNNAVIL